MNKAQQIEEMAAVMKDHTVKNYIMASVAILEEYADQIYSAGYRKQEWISVEERLPERNGRYLTHCNVEGQSLVCILYYNKVGGFNEGTVTHWMPLPEIPTMKGGAE